MPAVVYLIPSLLCEDAIETIPFYVITSIKTCNAFFVENERSARRFLKKIDKSIVIDEFEWHTMDEENASQNFLQCIKSGKTIGLVSEAGCPGVADPGQNLVSQAQELKIKVVPLVGPNSILLALMASGMNGQHFQFAGYLPIEKEKKDKAIRSYETDSRQRNCTQIFIETPYRNNALMQSFVQLCAPHTLLCIAVNITSPKELIVTKTIKEWKSSPLPDLHKQPTIFLILAG